jgi:hypothetical protein
MTTATTTKLTGNRITATTDWRNTITVGGIYFAVRRYNENTRTEWVELYTHPGRLNMSGDIARPGQWMGSSYGISETALGRVQVLRQLKVTEGDNRYQVRFLDETDAEYLSAAESSGF